ncbi:MAG: hypothetical protein HY670_07625 [Chloroflexi bacterium]|nr:hypothetical protein [Chloroflexota bacterium]
MGAPDIEVLCFLYLITELAFLAVINNKPAVGTGGAIMASPPVRIEVISIEFLYRIVHVAFVLDVD